MGTYKVIQDIEAEDKLLGPLSLRQFIYAVIVIVSGFVAYRLALVNPVFVIPLLPVIIFFGFLAVPISKDQPSEVWLLARIRFYLKPRRRIWDQSGIKELVTITAPKKVEHVLTNGLSQTEVRSRLEALANTIDSRGWAVKNVSVNMFAQPSYVLGQVNSDRLIDPSTIANEVPAFEVLPTDDMLDVSSNSRAQALDQMITTSTQYRKQQVIEHMRDPSPPQAGQPADYWFLHQGPQATQPGMATFNQAVVLPGQADASQQPVTSAPTSLDEQALLDKIHAEKAREMPAKSHLKTIKPLSEQKKETKHKSTKKEKVAEPQAPTVTTDPRIISLANNDDLNISTIARQAEQARKQPPNDEVVISLR